MDYVLFGAGNNGKELLKRIGHGRVAFFVDNNNNLHGLDIDGVNIQAYSKTDINILKKYYVVITVINKEIAMNIAYQLEEIGGITWTFYYLIENWDEISELDMERNKTKSILLYYRNYVINLRKENEWFREHTEAKYLKPARGYFRHKQIKLVKFAYDFFSSIKDIDIHPTLGYGNLLGFLRHGGFIPWDDDLDFDLLRPEYEEFKEYCKKRFIYIKYTDSNNDKDFLKYQLYKKALFEKHPHKIIFLEIPRHLMIMRGSNIFDACSIDIFSIDSYDKDYSFDEHSQMLGVLKREIYNAENYSVQFELLERFFDKDKRKWDLDGINLFFGGDNCNSYDFQLGLEKWIERKDYLPYKKQIFEGYEFYTPANPEAIVKHLYGTRWKDLPNEIGIPTHSYWQSFYEKHCDAADIIYSDKYSNDFIIDLYAKLRDRNDVYARIVIKNNTKINPEELDELKSLFEKMGIEYTRSINKYANTCYTDNKIDGWDYQNARVIIFDDILRGMNFES